MTVFQENSAINLHMVNNFVISPLAKNDISEVCRIEAECFSSPFKEQDFLSYLESPIWKFLVIKEENKVIGHISLITIEPEAQIANIAVSNEHRGKGAGKALLSSAIELCKSEGYTLFTLEVRESNIPAISLYKSFGFNTTSISKNHYTKPLENALLMSLNL